MTNIFTPGTDHQVPASSLPGASAQLLKAETWITSPYDGDQGWGQVKPVLFVRLTIRDEQTGWGEAFVLPRRETAVAEIIHAFAHVLTNLKDLMPWALRSCTTSYKHSNLSSKGAHP